MRTFLWMLAGFLLGAGAAFGIGILLPEIVTVSQAEGAYMMGVMFFWVPAGAVAGMLAGLVARLVR
ncbi:MAG: hypothetical protein ACT4OK_05435 [Gemmobacter sp.]